MNSQSSSRIRAVALLVGACWLLPSGPLLAQAAPLHPLPVALQADITPPMQFASKLSLVESTGPDLLNAFLGFSNVDGSRVRVSWHYRKGQAAPGFDRTEYATSFKVTAIASRAPTGGVLYVAGWKERSARVVIERWTFSDAALGETQSQGGGVPQSVFVMPQLMKQEIWESEPGDLTAPIRSLACFLPSNELWLLTAEDEPRVLGLDLSIEETIVSREVLTVTSHPYLAGARSLKAAKSKAGGFYILIQERLLWEALAGTYYTKQLVPALMDGEPALSEPKLHVFGDIDLDGDMDLDAAFTYSEMQALHPAQSWDNSYSAP